MAKLRVTWYTRRSLVVGPVELETLVPTETSELEVPGRPLDAVLTAAEQLMKSRKGEFALIEGEGPDTKYVVGEGIKDRSGTRLLAPGPRKLLRVGVIRLGQLSQVVKEGQATFSLQGVEWYDAPPDTYVYDGPLKAEEDVEYVLLLLDGGDVRVIRAPRLSRLLLSVTPPTEQGQGAPGGEPSEGEGSTPSS